ncbi:MAG: hypothetical protein RBG13Loki_1853, partial [Promethearchaeota archaeon CR_4]
MGQARFPRLEGSEHLRDAPGADAPAEDPVEFGGERGDVLVIFLNLRGGCERGEVEGLA